MKATAVMLPCPSHLSMLTSVGLQYTQTITTCSLEATKRRESVCVVIRVGVCVGGGEKMKKTLFTACSAIQQGQRNNAANIVVEE